MKNQDVEGYHVVDNWRYQGVASINTYLHIDYIKKLFFHHSSYVIIFSVAFLEHDEISVA